ncbi:hypothetical protein PINS_up008544 [Pythium insidiosum]|nr:hypothetical protein PINS_up008544 [Pythium insidiosum]
MNRLETDFSQSVLSRFVTWSGFRPAGIKSSFRAMDPMATSLTQSLLTPPAAREDKDCVLVALPERQTEEDDDVHEQDEVPAPPNDTTHFNFERTFRFMTERRLQRRYRGVYKRYSFTTQLVTWIIVIYTLAVLATFAFKSDIEANEPDREVSLADSAFSVFLVVLVVYFVVQAALVIRWMVYWVIVAGMIQYAVTSNLRSVFWLDPDSLTAREKRARDIVATILIVAEVLTVLVFVFTHHVYPWCVLTNKFDTIRWWDVKHSTTDSNTFTYRSRARFYTKKRNSIRYCGGLDAEMRPHGYGMWTDSSYHGERLTGQWEHGIPVGPYRSFEHGSGYCFVNLRIGYCHNRAEAGTADIAFWPHHAPDSRLHWGVATVECSVSGGFFRFLPAVRHLTPLSALDQAPGEMDVVIENQRGPLSSAAECAALLQTPADAVVYRDRTQAVQQGQRQSHQQQGLVVPGMLKRAQTAKRLIFRESSCPVIDLAQSEELHNPRGVVVEREALILLHGYNCSLDYGMNRLAQLLALGDFPSSIHPFVFSWPSGGALAYFQARSVGSESDRTAQDFRDFLRSLVDAGYTTINIIGHSMGARIYFYALTRGFLDDVFEVITDAHRPSSSEASTSTTGPIRKARLSTLTFANPDYERNEFVRRGTGGYDLSRRFCDRITLYADAMDGALFYSEILTRSSLFGPLNYSLGKRGGMMHRDPEDSRPQDSGDTIMTMRGKSDRAMLELAVARVNQQGMFEGVKSFAYNRKLRKAVADESEKDGNNPLVMVDVELDDGDDELEYLDMDVIDTTWMDNNVHAIRHNYFNLNPTVVDDIRSLIVTKQRAASRAGLLKSTSADNVYLFLVAPAHIKNK